MAKARSDKDLVALAERGGLGAQNLRERNVLQAVVQARGMSVELPTTFPDSGKYSNP